MIGCTQKDKPIEKVKVISKGLRFCEGTVPYGSTVLVSNFGTEAFNPLNNECKGYISIIEDNIAKIFIPADQNLSGPKGMAIKDDFLYIADVSKLVVYNLKNKSKEPQVIYFPPGNLYINDVAIKDNTAYISVTNSGRIFKLDISVPDSLDEKKLEEFINVPGANGLVIDNHKMYVTSYPADGKTTDANVIYIIDDLKSPTVKKLIERPGQYDGIALNHDKLYFTNWTNTEVGFIDLKTKEIELLHINGATLTGPADISILNDTLYIPNLPSSELIILPL